jgi:DNA polymerase III epsilon subunit-like protein
LGGEDNPIELAIVDGVTGDVLLDTRLRPSVPISAEAYMVHGISEREVLRAPTLTEV